MLKRRLAIGLVVLAAAAATFAWWPSTRPPPAAGANAGLPLRLQQALDGGDFERVPPNWAFAFPADHGPHAAYRTEWWYLTGVLDHGEPTPLGLQLAFTRLALTPDPPRRPSAWASSQVYVALLTLTDPAGGRPLAALRTSRAALGLAGAETGPARVWLGRWRLEQAGTGGGDAPDWKLRAEADGLRLELSLRNTKVPATAAEIAAATATGSPPFQFYLQPRLEVEGSLGTGGRTRAVHGRVTMEHAWGELPLPGGPVARDRFSLYLDDGRELFCLRRHRVDDPARAGASCVLVDAAGRATALSGSEVGLDPVEHWSSERTRARYPVGWTLRLPAQQLTLQLSAYSRDGEFTVAQPAWAGALRVQGRSPAGTVAGHGFMQLNGYHERGRVR